MRISASGSAADVTKDVVVISDPRVVAISAEDNAEPLVDLRDRGFTCRTDDRKAEGDVDWAHVRQGVADRLDTAQSTLPQGVRLLMAEGYRSIPVQTRYYLEHLSQLQSQHPDWDDTKLARTTALHVAPPEAAAHCTGGAIDLTLCDLDGNELDLGTPLNATPEASDKRCFTLHPGVTGTAKSNRVALIDALTGAGFVNYPPEWWHWSYGDRYWAFNASAPAALYGPVDR